MVKWVNRLNNTDFLTLAPADIARVWILAFLAPFLVITEDGGVFFTSPAERRTEGVESAWNFALIYEQIPLKLRNFKFIIQSTNHRYNWED